MFAGEESLRPFVLSFYNVGTLMNVCIKCILWIYCVHLNGWTVSVICKQITGFEVVHFVLSDCVNYYMYAQQHQSSMIIIVDESGHTISMRNLCNLVMQGVILP